MSTPLWLRLTPDEMACLAAGAYFVGALTVSAFAVAFVNHHSSTVGTSASGAVRPAPGAGIRAVGSTLNRTEGNDQSERDTPSRSLALSAVPGGRGGSADDSPHLD